MKKFSTLGASNHCRTDQTTNKIRDFAVQRLKGGLSEHIGNRDPSILRRRGAQLGGNCGQNRGHDGLDYHGQTSSNDLQSFTYRISGGEKQCHGGAATENESFEHLKNAIAEIPLTLRVRREVWRW